LTSFLTELMTTSLIVTFQNHLFLSYNWFDILATLWAYHGPSHPSQSSMAPDYLSLIVLSTNTLFPSWLVFQGNSSRIATIQYLNLTLNIESKMMARTWHLTSQSWRWLWWMSLGVYMGLVYSIWPCYLITSVYVTSSKHGICTHIHLNIYMHPIIWSRYRAGRSWDRWSHTYAMMLTCNAVY
jgi:hypothetical protein